MKKKSRRCRSRQNRPDVRLSQFEAKLQRAIREELPEGEILYFQRRVEHFRKVVAGGAN